jgi:hypothetical protein
MTGIVTERTYAHVDKSTWGDGPWQDEPEKIQWIDESTDLDCLIVRNPGGALCGYVGVPPEHPAHGRDYDNVKWAKPTDPDDEWSVYPDVHGGLTYADACQEHGDEAKGICHVPLPGRPADVWWLGFDCAHSGDLCPRHEASDRESGYPPIRFGGESYKTVDYVRAECRKFAQQLATQQLAVISDGDE